MQSIVECDESAQLRLLLTTLNEENNDSPPEYSTFTGLAQEQSAILIENEQLKAEIAVLSQNFWLQIFFSKKQKDAVAQENTSS